MSTTTLGIVLAAGSGQRYGKPKVTAADGHWLDDLLQNLSGDTGSGPFLTAHPDLLRVECPDLASWEDIDEE